MVKKIKRKTEKVMAGQKIVMIDWIGKKQDDTVEPVRSIGFLLGLSEVSITITPTLTASGGAIGVMTIAKEDIRSLRELELKPDKDEPMIIIPSVH